jgi:primase-polymerase (primpol)-like protein
LKAKSHWVVWRYTWNPGKKSKCRSGETGDWDKPPSNARTGHLADSTDPRTWCDFDKALATYEQGGWDGIGYVPTPDDKITIVDLDACRDKVTGVIEPWAHKIIGNLNTYSEISPSGRGVRIVARGRKPSTERSKKGPVELYDGRTKEGKPGGRYLTFTGRRVPGTTQSVKQRSKAVARLYRKTFGADANLHDGNVHQVDDPPVACKRNSLSDGDVVGKARAAKNATKFNRLWAGDISGYRSQSEADAALCSLLAFWTRDADQIDRLFRQSGLKRQ